MKKKGHKKIHKKGYRKVFKTILCLFLIIFIIVGPYYLITYRPHDVDYGNIDNNEPEWKGIISFWDYPRLDQKTGTQFGWIREKIKAFEKENSGVYIDFKPLDWEKGPIEINTAAKMGGLPDIVPIGSDYSLIIRDTLDPIGEYLTVDEITDFRDNALKSVTYGDKIYGLPWMMTTYTMVLNLDLFNENGVEPPENGNWTYDEFIEKMQALTDDSLGDEVDHYGINSFVQPGYYNIWGILLSDGAKIFNERAEYSFNDEKALSGVQKLIDLKQKHGVIHHEFGVNNSNQAWTSFYQDKNIAVYPVGTWALNTLDRLQSEGRGFNYDVAKFPSGDWGKSITLSNMVGSYGMSKQEDREKADMIVKFLKFLVKDEYQEELNRLGVFPAKKSIGNIYTNDPKMTMIYEELDNANIVFDHPYWKEIDEILQKEIQQGIIGNKTAKEVLNGAEEKVKVLLNNVVN